MIVKQLYRVKRADGGISVTPNKPEGEYELNGFRLIAEEGKAVTKGGEISYSVIDTDDITGWHEIEATITG
jgi:hypothetical protein